MRNSQQVIDEGQHQVLADVAHGGSGKCASAGDAGDDPRPAAVDRDEHRRGAVAAQCIGAGLEWGP